MEKEYKYIEITEKIIGAVYTVHNEFGYGFLTIRGIFYE